MRSLLLVTAAFLLVSLGVRAQSNAPERKGMILVRVSPALDSAMGAAFFATRPAGDPTFAHSDINGSVLTGDTAIRALMGLSKRMHGLGLRPFIPTHSVAFEDIRERSNPQLFQKLSYSISPSNNSGTAPASVSELKNAEEKVAHWFLLSYSDSISGDRASAIARKSPWIQLAEPKYIRRPLADTPTFVPNDSLVSQQYSLSMMDCFHAWAVVRCDSTMVVADADIGTDWTHQDLENSIYQNPGEIGIDKNGLDKRSNGIDDDSNGFVDDWHGWDFGGTAGLTPDNNPEPGAGVNHGTQTAGILGATGNNTIGIAGVAFGARIIPIKISDDPGANLDFGFQGMIYAADMHAKLVNCSWGGTGSSNAEQDIIDYVYAKDCLVVAAAGNNGVNQLFYPASYNHVFSIGATDQNGDYAGFSNFNTQIDVGAPGVSIWSTTLGNTYEAYNQSGTSFASPNTAGVVALVRQRFPNFTAGQAAQQVRVTGNPINGLASYQVFYAGHGLVDAYRAVTDTNTYSARVDTFSLIGQNGSGAINPGQNGSIVVRAMNYLKPLSNLKAKLELVSGAPYVTLMDSMVTFGAVGTLQTVSNAASSFSLSVSGTDVPQNLQVLIRLFFYDSSVGYDSVGGYWGDYDYVSFVVNPTYLDLDTNNVTVTFSSIGSIGYNDVLNNSEGSGFFWRNAPDSISLFGRQLLYEGGLMVGTDPYHVVDVVVDSTGFEADEDLTPNQNTRYVTPPDHANAAQELSFSLTDDFADSSIMIGLNASCQAYEFTQGLASNAVVARYVISGTPGGLLAACDSAAAALFLDWDIGPSGGLNITDFDSATSTAVSYRIEANYPYIGMKLLSAVPLGAVLNYHAIMNDGSQGDVDVYSGYSNEEKWLSMNEFYPQTGPGDISHTFGLKNMPIRSEDSVEMTVVFALAENQSLLDQTIAETEALWNENSGVTPPSQSSNTLEVFPNPFRSALHIAWDASGPALVTIYDAIGRVIVSQQTTTSFFDFSAPNIPSGFYMIDVDIAGTHLRREVVSEQ